MPVMTQIESKVRCPECNEICERINLEVSIAGIVFWGFCKKCGGWIRFSFLEKSRKEEKKESEGVRNEEKKDNEMKILGQCLQCGFWGDIKEVRMRKGVIRINFWCENCQEWRKYAF